MAAAAHVSGGPAANDDWQINMVMNIWIAHAAAVQVERVVEQGATRLRRGLELLKKFCEQRYVELIDLGHLCNFFRIVIVMGQRVMRIGNPDFRICPVTRLSR